jgi:uncharacterized protein YfaS (alpha-2-macroglobulin family)
MLRVDTGQPPPEMFASGLRNLQKMVTREPTDFADARTVAYGIYVLTREGVITTNYILNLRDWLEKREHDRWQKVSRAFISPVRCMYFTKTLRLNV